MAVNKKRRLATLTCAVCYQEPKDFFLLLLMRTLRFLMGAGAGLALR